MIARTFVWLVLVWFTLTMPADLRADGEQTRIAKSETELRGWLENMSWHHRYSLAEMVQVTGLTEEQLVAQLAKFNITEDSRPQRPANPMFVLPYPGGRHPRIGFLEGAIEPQRETKLSAFAPWDHESYAVLDVPEALWSNLGLTYLAHTHIDTMWTKQNINLPKQEWKIVDGNYEMLRTLPNGIEIGVKVIPLAGQLRMKMWLTNRTDERLSDLRVQNCVMLKGMRGFEQQSNDNKRFADGYAAVSSTDGARWIITGWDPLHRNWGNERCPCLHSDPKFPDCAPGETVWLRGWFSFYEGTDIESEIKRIEASGWRTHPLHHVTGNVVGKVVDAETGAAVPCRLYVWNEDNQTYHFARSTAVAGSAISYDRQLGKTTSIERHTTLSADSFQLDLLPGRYRVRAQLGKEFLPNESTIEVGRERTNVTLKLKRFDNMNQRGWFSGDTHVHRAVSELPNVQLAEDLNVALPLSYWVRDSQQQPKGAGPPISPQPVEIDSLHVYYPINTEYEIFTIDGQRHTQGAVFILNHQRPFELTAPPVGEIAAETRAQGAILDLDKHSWNWSAMIVPVMRVDLFELSNNHHWRTHFGFPKWTLENGPPAWPGIEIDELGFTERGWTEFGFQTYYAWFNCGFRMRLTAGTASGVHPVPLGHGRVYVHCGEQFSYQEWMKNLNLGHSFVTQGPLMDVRFNGELPGYGWQALPAGNAVRITGKIRSINVLERLEVVLNGEIVQSLIPQFTRSDAGSIETTVDLTVPVEASSCWLALRCFERAPADAPAGKVIFAHTNPVTIDIEGKPLQPRRQEVQYFLDRLQEELSRNRGVLKASALAEYAEAQSIYEGILQSAR